MINSTDALLARCTVSYHRDSHGMLYTNTSLDLDNVTITEAACGVGVLLGHIHNTSTLSSDDAALRVVLAAVRGEYERVVQGKDHNPLTGQDVPRTEA